MRTIITLIIVILLGITAAWREIVIDGSFEANKKGHSWTWGEVALPQSINRIICSNTLKETDPPYFCKGADVIGFNVIRPYRGIYYAWMQQILLRWCTGNVTQWIVIPKDKEAVLSFYYVIATNNMTTTDPSVFNLSINNTIVIELGTQNAHGSYDSQYHYFRKQLGTRFSTGTPLLLKLSYMANYDNGDALSGTQIIIDCVSIRINK